MKFIFLLILGICFLFYYSWSLKLSKIALHILQLEGYSNEDYREWCKKNPDRLNKENSQEKTPLVWTDRAKRLYSTHKKVLGAIHVVLFLISAGILFSSVNYLMGIPIIIGIIAIFYQHIIIRISNSIAIPRENKINMGFFIAAQNKIREKKNSGLKVVGITGSFGKTSTKFILDTILREKFTVLITPSSFNTPMGLSKVINNELEDQEVFIAELGAKNIGEIDEVAKLVQPDIGILTSIGPTHMQMFKTIENIQKTKYELIENLPEDGIAVFNYDNEYIKPLADKTEKETILYGMNDLDMVDFSAIDITVSEDGSKFTLVVNEEYVRCTTKLLGVHNIANILGAASVAYSMGMTLMEIKNGISKIEPVEHRLQLIDSGNGILVIDDAFNSNPVSSKAALEVLNSFTGRRKIIITPGMIELGEIEEEENYKFGLEISKVCDFAILVGKKRTLPIKRGILDGNFGEERLFVAGSLNEATEILSHLSRVGDVVLFENDLPDNYNE